MRLIFVHGWSVTNTDTYGNLPQALVNQAASTTLELTIDHIQLSRYISFNDQTRMQDIARALDQALRDLPGNNDMCIEPFVFITHSTGGPLVRIWLDHFYGTQLQTAPLKHLIQLAPANHGPALAIIGKSRIGRLKALFNGVEPGEQILTWLQLGSDDQWELNHRTLQYDYLAAQIYPFVFTGQGIDRKFFDFINSYLTEPGSDGVIRICAANLNTTHLNLYQDPNTPLAPQSTSTQLLPKTPPITNAQPIALRVYNQYSHSGSDMGIMRSIHAQEGDAPIVSDILEALHIDSPQAYTTHLETFAQKTAEEQQTTDHFSMLVFTLFDNEEQRLKTDEYDLLLLAGNEYQPQHLPKGFLVDKQFNQLTGRLTLYLDTTRTHMIPDGKIGIRINARPDTGFVRYAPAEFHGQLEHLKALIQPNQTTYINICLHRNLDTHLYQMDPASEPPRSFKKETPSGKNIDDNEPE
jgi:hypothetical protein